MDNKQQKLAIIIGGGPAGLTAAYELLENSNIKPIVLEAESFVGGISRTVNYKGNRIDIGGHRFFSKSDWVMNWWQKIMPIEDIQESLEISYQNQSRLIEKKPKSTLESTPSSEENNDNVMLVRRRLSRIFLS